MYLLYVTASTNLVLLITYLNCIIQENLMLANQKSNIFFTN